MGPAETASSFRLARLNGWALLFLVGSMLLGASLGGAYQANLDAPRICQ